ncbi:MAG: rod shape-determining protein [Clostridia bacterium]|nr:rod shape-determining protein [Clostridia bacterium]
MASVADIGIDLGTSNVVIYARGRGVVLNEPAVVALERDTRVIRAIGTEAYRMIGRTPIGIETKRPLRDGAVSDFELTSSMLHHFVVQVIGKRMFSRPRAVLSLPSGINENEKRNIAAVMFEAGVRRTQLLERPVAAAIGADMDLVNQVYGTMIVDIGAGMTDIAVLSSGRVVVSDAVKTGGDQFDEAIIRYLRRKHNLLVGERTAEELKISIGAAVPRLEQTYLDVTGRNLISGLPKLMRVTSDEIYEAVDEPLTTLIEAIHAVLEHTPAELAADVFDNGIVLTGGGAQLTGLAEAVGASLKVNCRVADDPQTCVAKGCGRTLENLADLGRYLGR